MARPMAKLDPTSPSNSSPLSRTKPSRPHVSFGSGRTPSSKTLDYNSIVFDHPSPTTSSSLSPPPTDAALSFDNFAPVGGIDPFGPNTGVTLSDASNVSSLMADFYQPSLPFDDDIMQSMQSMSDPNVWHDINLPGMFLPNVHLHVYY